MIEVETSKWVKIKGAKCYECPLCNRPFVPPFIPDNPVAIVVGEAPGATEIVKGQPFVGQSGKVLNEALEYAGIDPSRVAKTNAVLCRPQGNETPDKRSLEACQGALEAVLSDLPNTPVVSLGSTPLASLRASYGLPKDGVMKLRGQTFGRINISVHPAYVLRNVQFLNTFKSDIKKFFAQPDDQPQVFDWHSVSYTVIDNFEQLRSTLGRIKPNTVIAFDVETGDLVEYDKIGNKAAELLCLGIAVDFNHAYIITPNVVSARPDLWSSFFKSMLTVAHNGKYDIGALRKLNIDFELKFDTMLAHYALNENKGTHGLKLLAREYLGCGDYKKELIDDWFAANKIKKANQRYSLIPKDRLYQYNAIDCCVTLKLSVILAHDIYCHDLLNWPFNAILMPLSTALIDTEAKGIKIDRQWLNQVNDWLNVKLVNLHIKMQALAGTTFNPNAPMQVSKILYGQLGLRLTKRLLKPTSTNTGKEALEALPDHQFVNLLREYRRIEKMRNTYVEKLLELADVNDRVHINFNIHGTEIGRLSANDSLHGIPRPDDIYGQAIRSAFIADEGNVLVIGDYSQAELRVFAANSQDPNLIKVYKEGKDIHDQTARMLESVGSYFFQGYSETYDKYGKEDKRTKAYRVVAKNCNFGGLCYLGGAQGISGMLGGKIPIPTLQAILAHFHEVYPGAFEYAERQYQFLRQHGFVRTRFNRYRRFPILTNENEDEARKAAVHMVTASEASDLTNLSILELNKQFKRDSMQAKIVHSIHDSIIVECRDYEAVRVSRMMKTVMEAIGNHYIPEVPWLVDIEVSTHWVDRPQLDDTK